MLEKTNELTGAALDWAVAVCEYGYGADYKTNRYSTDWSLGGPVIERELIEIVRGGAYAENFWKATRNSSTVYGPTPLVAAMRCYVASKMGDEVELPKEN